MPGWSYDIRAGKGQFVPLTPEDNQRATDRRQKALREQQEQEQREQQRLDDLNSIKTAEIADLRRIVERLLS